MRIPEPESQLFHEMEYVGIAQETIRIRMTMRAKRQHQQNQLKIPFYARIFIDAATNHFRQSIDAYQFIRMN